MADKDDAGAAADAAASATATPQASPNANANVSSAPPQQPPDTSPHGPTVAAATASNPTSPATPSPTTATRSSRRSSSSSQKKKRVGAWIVENRIGSGSFATVWRAYHKTTGKVAAIKSINRNKVAAAKHANNLESEIRIMKNLKHENVVQLYDIQTSRQHIYLVLEYCAGGDLSKFIKKHGAMPEKNARAFLTQLAQGLRFLRDANLVHRDLKPQNLLLDKDRPSATLKIADFGFARYIQDTDMAATLCGSPLYMAPEILAYKKYDATADLWSVGTILYEMLVGAPPYTGANPMELLRNITSKSVRVPNSVVMSARCQNILSALLQKNPRDRIGYAAFFAHPFFASSGSSGRRRTSSGGGGAAVPGDRQQQQQRDGGGEPTDDAVAPSSHEAQTAAAAAATPPTTTTRNKPPYHRSGASGDFVMVDGDIVAHGGGGGAATRQALPIAATATAMKQQQQGDAATAAATAATAHLPATTTAAATTDGNSRSSSGSGLAEGNPFVPLAMPRAVLEGSEAEALEALQVIGKRALLVSRCADSLLENSSWLDGTKMALSIVAAAETAAAATAAEAATAVPPMVAQGAQQAAGAGASLTWGAKSNRVLSLASASRAMPVPSTGAATTTASDPASSPQPSPPLGSGTAAASAAAAAAGRTGTGVAAMASHGGFVSAMTAAAAASDTPVSDDDVVSCALSLYVKALHLYTHTIRVAIKCADRLRIAVPVLGVGAAVAGSDDGGGGGDPLANHLLLFASWLAQSFSTGVSKAQRLRDLLASRNVALQRTHVVCAEKLMFDWALKMARDGAVDELMGNAADADKKYRRSFRLFEQLLLFVEQEKEGGAGGAAAGGGTSAMAAAAPAPPPWTGHDAAVLQQCMQALYVRLRAVHAASSSNASIGGVGGYQQRQQHGQQYQAYPPAAGGGGGGAGLRDWEETDGGVFQSE